MHKLLKTHYSTKWNLERTTGDLVIVAFQWTWPLKKIHLNCRSIFILIFNYSSFCGTSARGKSRRTNAKPERRSLVILPQEICKVNAVCIENCSSLHGRRSLRRARIEQESVEPLPWQEPCLETMAEYTSTFNDEEVDHLFHYGSSWEVSKPNCFCLYCSYLEKVHYWKLIWRKDILYVHRYVLVNVINWYGRQTCIKLIPDHFWRRNEIWNNTWKFRN